MKNNQERGASFQSIFAIALLIIWSIIVLSPTQANAQKWKRRPWDATIGVGSTNFFGDLGGGQGDAAHFMGVKDLDFAATRPIVQVGLRYRFLERFSARLNIATGMIGANDELSGHLGRQSRNLHFRSYIVETNAQVEFYFIKEKIAARYRYSSVTGWGSISAYMFLGIGGVYFNPQAEYDGAWHSLQPLGTEGQGLEGGPAKYSRFAATFPGGVGLKYTIDRYWSVGAEFGVRYTTTDYIDDVSGSYYNADLIRAAYGDVAAALSDRNIDPHWVTEGQYFTNDTKPEHMASIPPRGSSTFNDAYMFLVFQVSYRFRYGLFGGMFGRGGKAKY